MKLTVNRHLFLATKTEWTHHQVKGDNEHNAAGQYYNLDQLYLIAAVLKTYKSMINLVGVGLKSV